MNVADCARLIDVSPDTVRRWTMDFRQFLSPSATPKKGQTRVLTSHDAAVLSFVATSRESGLSHEQIRDRLVDMQKAGWDELPEVPAELIDPGPDEVMPIETAALRASQVAQIAALNVELQHTRAEREQALQALESAQQKVTVLENEIATLRASSDATAAEMRDQLHTAQLELERAKQDVARMQGRLEVYNLGISDQPISPVIIVVMALFFALALVILVVGVLVWAG